MDEKPELDLNNEEADSTQTGPWADRDQAKQYVCAEITRYSVEILDYYSKKMSKSDALGLTIESLSESLGNLISVVPNDEQPDVLETSQKIIHQGLVNQHELIAQITYGCVGHA